jgi:predicted transcriptional regulator
LTTDEPATRVTGKSGKSYPATRRKRNEAPKRHYAASEIIGLHDAGKSNKEIATTTGIGERQIRHVVDEERIRRDAIAGAVAVDINTLSPTAKEKLDAAIKQEKRKHAAEHATRLRGIDEEVRLRVIAENKDYLAMVKEREAAVQKAEQWWQYVANDHKPLFTVDQFKTVLMCLHPDGQRTADKLAEAFRLFKDKQVQLTGKRV